MQMELSFWGLCALIERVNGYEVVLPTGKVVPKEPSNCEPTPKPAAHVATLTVPVSCLDKEPSWTPTFIIHHENDQLACWHLPQGVEFAVTAAARRPGWSNPHKTIQLKEHHPRHSPKDKDGFLDDGYSVFLLGEGDITGSVDKKFDVRGQEKHIARKLTWRSKQVRDVNITWAGTNKTIKLKDNANASVTNVSTTMAHAHEHFVFYYTLLEGAVECDDRLTPHPKSDEPEDFGPDVYDCVPPIGGS